MLIGTRQERISEALCRLAAHLIREHDVPDSEVTRFLDEALEGESKLALEIWEAISEYT